MKLQTSTKKDSTDFEKPHIDEGIYVAELIEVKDITEGQYGQRVAFIYRIISKEVELALVCYKTKATKDNKIGQTLIAHGKEIDDSDIETDSLIGSKVNAWVEDWKPEGDDQVRSTISKIKPLSEKVN